MISHAYLFGIQEAGALAGLKSAWTLGDLPERFVVWLHRFVPEMNDGLFRGLASPAWPSSWSTVLLRRLVTRVSFSLLQRITGRTKSPIDHRVVAALKAPAAALIMLWGIFTALSVINLSPELGHLLDRGSRVALTGIALWSLMCAGAAALDHLEKVAWSRGLGIATFMPLIKKTMASFYGVVCVLAIAASLGVDVKTFLAGLGIGGLAVALAAQDTIANMFGSLVVVMDHPFRVGDAVRIAGNEGTVEDIGLRSTRLRTPARTQVVIPNKTVASEAITNFSRMPQRRVEQKIGLTYATTPQKMEMVLEDLRGLLRAGSGGAPEFGGG